MRLSQEKIKAGILHADQAVRDAAARHFSQSYTCDTSILPLAVEAVQRYGWDNAFLTPCSMARLPLDETSLSWVLEEIKRKKARPFTYWAGRHWDTLQWLLCGADAHLLARHQDDIESLYDLDSDVRSYVLRRIVMLRRESEVCWRELEQYCLDVYDLHNPSRDADNGRAFVLIEAIARQKERYAERALSLLEERLDDEDAGPRYWMQCFAARMAGEMRLEAAAPLLIAKLEQLVDADFMDEQCSRALAQIGGDDMIRAAAEIVRRDGNGVLAACHVLEGVHSDQAAASALELLPVTDSPYVLTLLGGRVDQAIRLRIHRAVTADRR